jgi:hypothetical protein
VVQVDVRVRYKPGQTTPEDLSKKLLCQYIEKSVTIEYNEMLLRADKMLKSSHGTVVVAPLSEEKLLLVCDLMDEELFNSVPEYASVFKSHVRLEELSSTQYPIFVDIFRLYWRFYRNTVAADNHRYTYK